MKILKQIILIVVTVIFALSFSACQKKTVDYSEYSFTDISWTRKTEHDIETIRFSSDGSYSYWCACGNPVNDSDLNEGYTYDDKTKTITISYIETTEDTISKIKIKKYDDKSIELDFDGEIREFVIDLS